MPVTLSNNDAAGVAASAFSHVSLAPPNAIFLTKDLFKADGDARKINLGVGAYRDNSGKPYVLPVVKAAEKLIEADASLDHEYLPIGGLNTFVEKAKKLAFGDAADFSKIAGVQTISGTGSLGVGANFLKEYMSQATVHLSNPTWGNHGTIFKAVGMKTTTYRYWDPKGKNLDIDGMLADLNAATAGDVIVLHACAHNPTGVDATPEQWKRIADVIERKALVPYFDCAYQGFATGDLEADSYAMRYFANERGMECLLSQSFAKNFGLYNERAGTLQIVCGDADTAQRVRSQLCILIRRSYSNPPAHGARIVDRILGSPELYAQWKSELTGMSHRIQAMRKALKAELTSLKTPGNWDHITSQIGMFSFTGLTKPQCQELKKTHHIYLLDNGRISMAGLNTGNVQYFAKCVDHVVRNN